MNLSRRCLLGSAGAAALGKILLPFRPKPSDIVLADETPANNAAPVPVPPPEVSTLNISECGPVVSFMGITWVVQNWSMTETRINSTEYSPYGWRSDITGLRQLRLSIEAASSGKPGGTRTWMTTM